MNNILPEEHIITPEVDETSNEEVDKEYLETSHNDGDTNTAHENEDRNEEAMNRYNLQRKTTKPMRYKETRNYVKQTIGKQFIQLAKTLNSEIEKENAKIKNAKKQAKKLKTT